MTVNKNRAIKWKLDQLMDLNEVKSINSLSLETGISRVSLTKMMDNKTRRIDFQTVETLCAYFDCNLSDLISISEM